LAAKRDKVLHSAFFTRILCLRKANLQTVPCEQSDHHSASERLATIGATAGMVGHDIRNPLQSITGDLYLAKIEANSLPSSETKNNILESLTETEKNIEYINKIFRTSKTTPGLLTLKVKKVT
jgi:K+-sensing histidine kinase KdpD